jgi:hypothetical protein
VRRTTNCRHGTLSWMFDPTYIAEVLAGRAQVEWITASRQTDDFVTGPSDIYVQTADGTVTWGWSFEPIPVDPEGRRFRRFRHPDGWAMLTDWDDPETIFLPAATEIHTVTDPSGAILYSLAIEAGSAPGSGDAYSLQKAADGGGTYKLDVAWRLESVSKALALWCEIFLGSSVEFVGRAPTPEERDAIESLIEEPETVVSHNNDPLGHDDEIAALIEGYDDVFWFQADLSWPDRDDNEAFRDRIDIRIRDSEGVDTWLLSVEPLDETTGRLLEDGGLVVFDAEDPSVMKVDWDRMVLAVSVQQTGFEPAGVAVALGAGPGTEQWEELRRVRLENPDSVIIHAPAWSETRISLALTEWASAWTGAAPRFVYDFDDPVSQAAIEANNLLESAAPAARSIRTATRQTCVHTDDVISPHENPLPCGVAATAYYRSGDEMVLVCDAHSPAGVKLTTLLRA